MTELDNKSRNESLTDAQQRVVSYVDKLAVNEGGPTTDVVRSADYPAFPGVMLEAAVIDVSEFVGDDDDDSVRLHYALSICAEPGDPHSTLESLWVNTFDKKTYYFIGDGYYPFGHDQSAPDEVIDSFIERYSLEQHAG